MFYYVRLNDKLLGTIIQVCTHNAIDELPSLSEFICDLRENNLLAHDELPAIFFDYEQKSQLSERQIKQILKNTGRA